MAGVVRTEDGCRLWADQAGAGPPLRVSHLVDSLHRALPHAERVSLPGAGHLPCVEDPHGFRHAVTTFLT